MELSSVSRGRPSSLAAVILSFHMPLRCVRGIWLNELFGPWLMSFDLIVRNLRLMRLIAPNWVRALSKFIQLAQSCLCAREG